MHAFLDLHASSHCDESALVNLSGIPGRLREGKQRGGEEGREGGEREREGGRQGGREGERERE